MPIFQKINYKKLWKISIKIEKNKHKNPNKHFLSNKNGEEWKMEFDFWCAGKEEFSIFTLENVLEFIWLVISVQVAPPSRVKNIDPLPTERLT